jgi:beta-lactamase superfamily II metal-dependent hydrolase
MVPTYTFFAVGKGHMVLVQFSGGFNMLMDCRRTAEWPSPLQYLKSKIRTLDMAVVTHPHLDHLTGLREVCEFFKPGVLWHNGRYFKPDPVYDDWSYYERLRSGKVSFCTPVSVYEGYTATIGDSRIYVCGPKVPNIQGTSDDENNNGIILAITTGKSKVVLTGDTEEEQWNATTLTPLAAASVFLASHHGREDGFSKRAMDIIKPQRIVISDGEPAETDATAKYAQIAPTSTTRNGSVVVRASHVAAAV